MKKGTGPDRDRTNVPGERGGSLDQGGVSGAESRFRTFLKR